MRLLLIPLILATTMSFGYQPATRRSPLPFVLTWLEGRCVACKTADSLGSLHFTNDSQVWGVGDRWPPPGAEGTGDHIIVHSQDGGRTWTEISYTYMHAVAPSVSFLDTAPGWIAWRAPLGDLRLQNTRDGGKSWDDVPANIDLPHAIDETHWYAAEQGKFLSTDDGGKTWRETQISQLGFVDNSFFVSREVGWIASADDKALLIFRTVDGGRTWKETRTTLAERIGRVDDLFFVNATQGWLITSHDAGRGFSLLSTSDGGETWKRRSEPVFQGGGKSATVVCFLSTESGFVFETEQASTSVSPGTSTGALRCILVYTSDGGANWREQILPRYVTDCQVFKGGLRCSAADDNSGFWVLTLHLR